MSQHFRLSAARTLPRHKMRQSLLDRRDETPLSRAVEIDGGYTNGSVRPANRA